MYVFEITIKIRIHLGVNITGPYCTLPYPMSTYLFTGGGGGGCWTAENTAEFLGKFFNWWRWLHWPLPYSTISCYFILPWAWLAPPAGSHFQTWEYKRTHTVQFNSRNHGIKAAAELEFLKNLWGLGSEKEWGCRTGPPGYIGWRNSFNGICSWAP